MNMVSINPFLALVQGCEWGLGYLQAENSAEKPLSVLLAYGWKGAITELGKGMADKEEPHPMFSLQLAVW